MFLHACFKTESTNDFSIFHTTRSTDICTHTLKNKGLYTDHISGCSLYNVYIIVCLEEAMWRDEYGHDVIRVLKNFVPEGFFLFFFFWGGGINWVRIRIVVNLLGFPTNQSGQRISLILWNWTDSKAKWNPFVKWIPRIKVRENNICMLSIF